MTAIRPLPTSKRLRDMRLALSVSAHGLDDVRELQAIMLEARALEDTAARKLGRVIATCPTAARKKLTQHQTEQES